MVTETPISAQERAEIREQIRNLKNDMSTIKDDVRALVQELVQAGKATASDARERIEQGVAHAADATKDTGRRAVESIEEEVHRRPFSSLGVAALVGFVIGAFMLRGKD